MYASANTLTAAPLDTTLETQAILEKLFGAQAISRAESQALFSAIVHGGGMDEVALHAPTQVAELRDGKVETYALTHRNFGLESAPAFCTPGRAA